jgi:hypothetical protein
VIWVRAKGIKGPFLSMRGRGREAAKTVRLRLTSETQLSKELCPSSKKHCVCCLVRRMLLAYLKVVMPTLSANLYTTPKVRRETTEC